MGFSPNLAIPEVDPSQDQKEVTQNNAIAWLDNAANATFAVAFTANAYAVTATQFTQAVRFKAGVLTAAGTLTIPLTARLFVVDNVTSGFPLTVKGATGATAVLPAGVSAILACDGANCLLLAFTTGTATPRNKGALQAQFVLGTIAVNGTFWFSYKVPYAGTITSLDAVIGTGSFTLAVAINGTPVTGLGAVAVTSSAANTPPTALNTFNAGDAITGTISTAAGGPTGGVLNLNVVWS